MKMARILKFCDDFAENFGRFLFISSHSSFFLCIQVEFLCLLCWRNQTNCILAGLWQYSTLHINEWMKKSKSISIDCSKSANSRNKLLLVFRFSSATTMRSFKMRNEIHCIHFDHTNSQSHVTMCVPGRDYTRWVMW